MNSDDLTRKRLSGGMMGRFGRIFLVAAIAMLGLSAQTAAQGTVTWGRPFNVSNSVTGSNHPVVVADAYGYVHVFWSEDMNGPEMSPDEAPKPGNTIMYRRWDGERWGEPLDILAVPGDPLAEFVAATVDSANQLHLVWTGLTNIYYSTAPAHEAYSVRAWSTPQVISGDSARTAFESDVAVDSTGNVHVLFATRGGSTGVFHTVLSPGSLQWTAPVRVSGYLRENEAGFKDVRLTVDPADRLHATWSTANTNGFSQAVYYARSQQPQEAWEEPRMLADASIPNGFTGFPSLLAYDQDKLLLIHVDEKNKGRIELTSDDSGRTWSAPRLILPTMEGVNGFLVPLADDNNNLHLVINMRPSADQRTGIYYAPRSGLDWAPIVAVAVEDPWGPHAHYTDATIRLGNEIHVVWTQLAGGEIWHVSGLINGVPERSKQEAPATRPAENRPSDVQEGTIAATRAAPSDTSRSGLPLPPELASPPPQASSLAPVLLSSGLAFLVVVAAIAVALGRRRL